jgi:hypothetical protein
MEGLPPEIGNALQKCWVNIKNYTVSNQARIEELVYENIINYQYGLRNGKLGMLMSQLFNNTFSAPEVLPQSIKNVQIEKGSVLGSLIKEGKVEDAAGRPKDSIIISRVDGVKAYEMNLANYSTYNTYAA